MHLEIFGSDDVMMTSFVSKSEKKCIEHNSVTLNTIFLIFDAIVDYIRLRVSVCICLKKKMFTPGSGISSTLISHNTNPVIGTNFPYANILALAGLLFQVYCI